MKVLLSLLFALSIQQVSAQSLAINTDASPANASAILDVKSTLKGMLIPRMSSVERTGIAAPASGLLVYDVDSLAFSYYNGTVWTFLKADTDISKGWSLKGNNGTDTAINFLGTKDDMPLRFKLNNNWAGQWDLNKKNYFIGNESGQRITTGNNNVGIGDLVLTSNTSGFGNVAIGSSALYSNTDKNHLVAIGDSALYNNGVGAASITQGADNIAIGSKTLYSNTIGYGNTATGVFSLKSNTSGGSNTAHGAYSLQKNTTGIFNTATGSSALNENISGNSNTAVGVAALHQNTTGYSNVAIGRAALFYNKYQNNIVAIGDSALFNNGFGTTIPFEGSSNTAIGSKALLANTFGVGNTALGYNSLTLPTSGINNTAIGAYSNVQFSTLTNATAIGALSYVATSNSLVLGSINGINSATVDTKVGIGVNDPSEKLEIGKGRLRFRGNVLGGNAHGITWTNNAGTIDRAFFGMETDDLIGIYNFGFGAWNFRINNSSGEVGINKQPLLTNNDSRLQVKQTGLQNGIGIESSANTNHWDWYVTNAASSDLQLYYNGVLKGTYGNAGGAYTPSDKRLKKDISLLNSSINQINKLEAYQYHYLDNTAADALSYGFMAQDVQKLFPEAVKETDIKNGEKRLGINYQYFTVLAIKGIQEQQQIIENQNKKIENLQAQIDDIKKLIKKD
jgi:co-chaperonin GroES (HSP10)